MPRTVLHVAQPVDGGVAVVVASLAARQVRQGYDVAVACPESGWLHDAVAAAGARVLRWEARRSPGPSLGQETARIGRVVSAVRPDVLHLHSSKAGLAGRLAVRGRTPTVFQPHAWSFAAVTGATAWASARWERAGARWAHRLVCVSEAERADGVAAGVRARYTVVPNGVDLERFEAAGGVARAEARERLGLAADAPLVVCVGRLCRQKGQDVLLAAWPSIAARTPGARLALVGGGPARPALEAAARTAALDGAVSFAGDASDPRPWYHAADLVVLPSRWEGMALVPLEAMACARPVVLSDVPGARESVADAMAGVVVPPENPEALADAVSDLLADGPRREKLGTDARAHMCAHHDAGRMAQAMSAVYDEAMAAGGPKV